MMEGRSRDWGMGADTSAGQLAPPRILSPWAGLLPAHLTVWQV